MNFEKPLFFFSTLFSFASSLRRDAGLRAPCGPRVLGSSSILRPVAAKLSDNLTSGLATFVLSLGVTVAVAGCVGRALVRSECWWGSCGGSGR